MNKNLPAFAPLAVVIVAAAIAGVAIVSQSGMSDGVAVVPVVSQPATQSVPAGTVSVVNEASHNTASAAESVMVGQSKLVSWNVKDYPSATVNVTIIHKISNSPLSYQPVRVIANVPNTGSISWTPTAPEIGNDMFVEVGCTATAKACQAHISPVSYTVIK